MAVLAVRDRNDPARRRVRLRVPQLLPNSYAVIRIQVHFGISTYGERVVPAIEIPNRRRAVLIRCMAVRQDLPA